MHEIFSYFSDHWVIWLFSLANVIITFSCQKLAKSIRSEIHETTLLKGSTRALLRSQLLSQYNYYYLELKHCPLFALENIEELYLYYTQLGGNGTITQLVEKLRALPISSED